jgi:hypothetical protein
MSILRFFQRDPTQNWPLCRAVPLTFNTVRSELNGISLGAPLDALRALGRPSNPKPRSQGQCAYAPLGLEVSLDSSDRVHFFTCLFQPVESASELSGYPDFRPCHLTLQLSSGAQVKITPETSAVELEKYLGSLTPEEFGGEPLQSVTIGDTWLGFSFDPAGRLILLDIEPAPSAA